jgi:hypothetical protein
MTSRKGEITRADLKRKWPHHVALPADKVRGVMNSQIVWSFVGPRSLSPGWGRGLNTRNAATARTVIVTPGARRCSGRTPLEGCDEWRVSRRATQSFGGMAMQLPNPQASPLSSWDVYRQAHKAIWLGTVEATDERDAIEKVAKERNIPANRLIATRHR